MCLGWQLVICMLDQQESKYIIQEIDFMSTSKYWKKSLANIVSEFS